MRLVDPAAAYLGGGLPSPKPDGLRRRELLGRLAAAGVAAVSWIGTTAPTQAAATRGSFAPEVPDGPQLSAPARVIAWHRGALPRVWAVPPNTLLSVHDVFSRWNRRHKLWGDGPWWRASDIALTSQAV
jgi:hypothetical protein